MDVKIRDQDKASLMTIGTTAVEASFYNQPMPANRTGLASWLLTYDHKRIGLLYLWSVGFFFIVAVTAGFLMRLEMMTPGETIMTAQQYNELFTLHGVVMVFLFIIPAFPGILGNFFLPIMIGARDVFFPKLNLLSWYLYWLGAIIALTALFLPGGPSDTGWTFYIPYSVRSSTNVSWALLGAFIIGFSSIVTGLNFIVTTHRMRAPGMGFFQMPLFVWAQYATAWIQVLATPILGITLLLIVIERWFGVGIFDPTLGGDPVLYQHMFWIYSHPAVYIMVLPAMGIVSEIIATFTHRTIFGYKFIAGSSVAIAVFGSLVWAHHMFTVGMSDPAMYIFSLLTFLVSIPSAIKIFNWVATMYKGSIALETPLLHILSFLVQFSIGGFTGMMLGVLSVNQHVQDTYFVVAHFHYVMFGGTAFAFFGAMHYWFPKMFGKMYFRRPSVVAWVLTTIGFNMLYFPLFIAGYLGMPRRYYDYLPEFAPYHLVSMVGSWVLVLGLTIMLINLLVSMRRGPKAPADPWGGVTFEWKVPSPPPVENFAEIPAMGSNPYDFSKYEKPAEAK